LTWLGFTEGERLDGNKSREDASMKCANKFVCFLAGLSSLGLDQVEAGFVVQPNDVATSATVSTADFHIVFYGSGHLPDIVNEGAVVADFEGGVTPTTIAVSKFSGSFSGGGRLSESYEGGASAGAKVAVSGPDESYYVQDSISVNGFIAPGASFGISGSFTVTDGKNVTYYQNVFNFQPLPVQGNFSLTLADPFHGFADYLGNNISQLQVNASFGIFFPVSSAVGASYVNYDGFVLVTTVPEPSSILQLSVALAALVGFLGVRRRRRPRPLAV
jgi:hypothetical protein